MKTGDRFGMTRRTTMALLSAGVGSVVPDDARGAPVSLAGPVELKSSDSLVFRPTDFGMTGRFAEDATRAMQAMFDQVPPGAIVDFTRGIADPAYYRTTNTVVVRQPISLRAQNSWIIGDMRDERTDLLRYEPETEMRGVAIEGLRIKFAAGGRDALVFAGGKIGVIGNVISRCVVSGGAGGYAVHLDGIGNQYNVVRDCTLLGSGPETGAVFIDSSDGNKLLDNVIAGIGAGVRLQLVNGAYKTGIVGGAIVSRDIGVHILAGQQIDIERVQFEQGGGHATTDENQARDKSHIVVDGSGVYPTGEEVRDVRIYACNFGSGPRQSAAITLVKNTRDVLIEENFFARVGTSGFDIVLRDPSVLWTRVGANNRVGGPRAGLKRGASNRMDPKSLLYVSNAGTGTYGVDQSAQAMALTNGWAPRPGFGFWKTEYDILHFRSGLVAGKVTAGTVIGILPDGFRPATEQRVAVPTDSDSDQALLAIGVDGKIAVRSVHPEATLYLDQLAVPVVGRSSYLSGP